MSMFDCPSPVLYRIALLCWALVGAPAVAQEGALSQLYSPRPPASAAYVRVVNPQPGKLRVQVAQGTVQDLGEDAPASTYAIVPGGQMYAVKVNGVQKSLLQARPDSFTTLVLQQEKGVYTFFPIDDAEDTPDALKAQLRFYNLAGRDGGEGSCPLAHLVLATSKALVFQNVAPNMAAARSVNPVKASLVGQCGPAFSAAVRLPILQPGDHLSLFLVGSAAAPVLRIQASRTDVFRR